MGFFDFLRRKKVPALPEGTQERTAESVQRSSTIADLKVDTSALQPIITEDNLFLDRNAPTQIFTSTIDGILTYSFCRNNVSGERIELATFKGDDLKQKGIDYFRDLVKAMDSAINTPFDAKPEALNGSKLSTKARLEALAKNHPGLMLNPNIFTVVDHIQYDILKLKDTLISGNGINYKQLDSAIPKTIDISGCSDVELRFLGSILQSRLSALDGINTVDEALSRKDSIAEFMKSREDAEPLAKVLSLLGDNIQESELPVIIKYARALESKPNEDGLLYSAYLKLEETRIISQIQQEISEYQKSFSESDVNYAAAQEQINYLESLKTKPYPNATSENSLDKFGVIDFMIKTIQGINLEDYISVGMKYDSALRAYLKQCPIAHKDEALQYTGARLSCLGQVSNIPDENRKSIYPTLRRFIETTDCKVPEDEPSKEFLLVMAQTEKDYILKNYAPILEAYKKITQNLLQSKD